MEEIAAAAGVAKGTLYLYFPSKDELIQALITQVGENMLADIEAVVEAPGAPPEKIQQVASLLLDYLMRERALFPAYARDMLRGGRGASQGLLASPPGDGREIRQPGYPAVCRRASSRASLSRPIPGSSLSCCGAWCGPWATTRCRKDREKAVKEALPVLLTLLSSGLTRQPQSSCRGGHRMKSRSPWRLILLGVLTWSLDRGRRRRGRGSVHPGSEGSPAPGLEGQPHPPGEPAAVAHRRRRSGAGPVGVAPPGQVPGEPDHL